MAALKSLISFTTLAAIVQTALGANHLVGGAGGWTVGTDFTSWASPQSFKTGDTLTFSYGPLHSLVEVSKADYDACSLSNSKQSFTDGNTVVKLSAPGKRYFICGTPGHCDGGMKVEINTVSAAVAAPPPTKPSTPPPATPSAPPPANPLTPPPAKPSTPPSEAPTSVLPSEAAPLGSPILAPVITPTAASSSIPALDLPEIVPTPQVSGAARIGIGLAAGMMMVLVL